MKIIIFILLVIIVAIIVDTVLKANDPLHDIVYLYKYSEHAYRYAIDFYDDNRGKVEDVALLGGVFEIKFINGQKHYFMSETTYALWNKGKTYRIFGEHSLYHSGYPISEEESIRLRILNKIRNLC